MYKRQDLDSFDYQTEADLVRTLESIGLLIDYKQSDKICTLPSLAGFNAEFCKEEFSHKVSKLFREELQVGIPEFDNAVFISTDNIDLTAQFLKSREIREVVLRAIQGGGFIAIKDQVVQFHEADLSLEQMALFSLHLKQTCR